MSHIPADIIREAEKLTGSIDHIQRIGGGCINNGAAIRTSVGEFFIKWNSKSKFPGMFEAEASGLNMLREPGCIRVPEVKGIVHGDEHEGIILEFIENRRTTDRAGERMGRGLAQLHRCSASTYGLPFDNYMGSLIQQNTQYSDLITFFIECRLKPQMETALKNGRFDSNFQSKMDRLYGKLPDLLFEDQPALMHGDLWGGNYLVDMDENPVLIDPAVSYGNREMDIAMTTLFGGFPDSFYTAYQEAWPLEPGANDRFEIYTLYPLLIHVNLFGGGYATQVRGIVQRYM